MPKKENKIQIRPEHPYYNELGKFIGKTIEVKDILGETIRGKCLGINKIHLNVVVETKDDVIICKNIQTIRRSK